MKRLVTICLAAVMVSTTSANYIPGANAPPPVLDEGWFYDEIDAAFVDSIDSPYIYNLTEPAYFRISDNFVEGDIFYVYDNSSLILTTSIPFSGVPTGLPTNYDGYDGDLTWQDPAYSGGEVILGVGAHYLTVQGDGGGGTPAGFWTQITTVPEPATVCLMGLGTLCLMRKRRG